MRSSFLSTRFVLGLVFVSLLAVVPVQAQLTVTPITWNIIGLDSNDPATGPNQFPVGARVCNTSAGALTGVTATFNWTSANPYIALRPGTLSSISLGTLAANTCADAYFEVEVTRTSAAFKTSRRYTVTAVANGGTVTGSTPVPRELYVEYLVSQARNAVTDIAYRPAGPGPFVSVAPGGALNLIVGNTYDIRLTGGTATQGYEQFEEFINFSNAIFQILGVTTDYAADSSPLVNDPSTMLYADACGWENDPNSPNYRACTIDGKAGGAPVVTIYTVKILSGGGNVESLNSLLYDFSGSSFHYNADYGVGGRIANIIDPASANFSKSFTPATIEPNGTSTLVLTINNPNAGAVSGYNFVDNLPGNVTIASPANATATGCGAGAVLSATAGTQSISLSNATVAALGNCVVSVTVTSASASLTTHTNTTQPLFVGTTSTGKTASANLTVDPAAVSNGTGLCGVTIAQWTFPTGFNVTNPAATSAATGVNPTAAIGAGLTAQSFNESTISNLASSSSWSTNGSVAGPSATLVTANNDYFEFAISASTYTSVNLSFHAQRRNVNGPRGLAVYAGTTNTRPETGTSLYNNALALDANTNWNAFSVANIPVNPSGTTYVRIYGFNAGNATSGSDLSIDNVTFTGCATVQKPSITKVFGVGTLAVGQSTTLTFTLANTNSANLTGAAFSDTLPAGIVVSNPPAPLNGCGGVLTAGNGSGVISYSGGTIPANGSCNVQVTVTANTAGPKTNISGQLSTVQSGTTPTTARASLNVILPAQVEKRFAAAEIVQSGVVRLTLTIINPNADAPLAGIAVSDTFPAGMTIANPVNLSNNCGGVTAGASGDGTFSISGVSLAAGALCSVSFNVVAPGTLGSAVNTTSTVTTTINGSPVNGNTDTATVLVEAASPSISLGKQVGPTASGPWTSFLARSTTAPGNEVFYRFTLENTGDVPLTAVTLTDPNVSVANCNAALSGVTLAVPNAFNENHYTTCVVGPVTVSAPGSIPNTASVSANPPSGPAVTDSATATYATVGVAITKDGTPDTYSLAGQTINYSYTVTNNGFAALEGPVTVTDDKTTVSCPDVSSTGDLDAFLDPGESVVCTASYVILASDVSNGSVTNTATASIEGVASAPVQETVTFSATPAPAMTVVKNASTPTYSEIGQVVNYTYVVTNTGNVAISGISVTDDKIATVNCPSTSLAPTAQMTCTGSYTIVAGDLTGTPGTVTNLATVNGTPTGGTLTPPTDTVTITEAAHPIAANDDSIGPFGNGSPTTTASVLVNDTLNGGSVTAGVNVSLTPGTQPSPLAGSITMNPNGTITIAAGTTPGTYTYQYTICEIANPTNCSSATATIEVEAAPTPSLTIDKVALTPTYATFGQVVNYTYLVTNTGNVTINGISITDDKIATVNCPQGSLAAGTNMTCTGSYTITQNDLTGEPGTVTNLATVNGTPTGGTLTPPTDTVTITEVANAIVANNDAGGPVNGTTGANDLLNVLGNDTLNGAQATTSNVTLAPVSNGPLSIDANGNLDVAPGTAAGTYSIFYTICEILNSTNCDTAEAVVTVTLASVDAVDDAFGPINGASGATTASVVMNDTFNGGAATIGGNVTLTPGAAPTPAAGSITMNPDGTITIAPGTTAGTYTYSYTLCEQGSSTNCDTATATITVSAAVIDAVNDAGGPVNGTTGANDLLNVLTNDTLNGAQATTSNVTLAPVSNGPLSIDANGNLDVAPGTAAGTYSIFYTICEILNSTNCDTAEAVVTVTLASVDAVDDAFGPINGASGATTASVVANDTFNGGAATIGGNVTLTPGAAPTPAAGSITMNPDGTITIAPGTTAGTYTYSYTLCEQGSSTNCDTATATITVSAAVIDAVNDAGGPVNGTTGANDLLNVLTNDTLNGAPATTSNVTLSPVSSGPLTIDANGNLDVAAGTAAGTYTINYTICEILNPTNCDTATATVTVTLASVDAVDDAFGPINGASGATTASVIVNDTFNGGAATIGGNVTLTPGTAPTPAAGSITMNSDGTITIAPGTTAGTYTYGYTLCEQGSSTNCDTATATITVSAAVIDAVNDAGGPVNGTTGANDLLNVLTNDTLNGAQATTSNVTLSPVSSGPLTIDANGNLDVAAGTAAGTYTINYTICEILNPTNCDTATATVTVGAAVIDAVDDTGTVANGATGGTAVPNVLVNDTLNGAPATLANVTLAQVSTSNPNVTLDPASGAVNVAPGTPAGTYTVVYQICEQLNPSNCDTATVTITVGAAVIDAVDDDYTGTPVNGAAGGNLPTVLSNDTLNGAAATVGAGGNTTLTPGAAPTPGSGSITMNADGTITVAPGTSSGIYTYTYTICEVLNPTNCDTAIASLVVGAAVIDAVDDTGTVANGATGGVAVPNVLVNDTLNGAPATLATVVLTQLATTNPNVTLNPATGEISVAGGTPAGTYVVTYEICEILNPTNCDVAIVTVTVGAAVIDAVDDTGVVANGATGGTAVPNVLVNDTLNGAPATLANVVISQVATSNPNVTLNPASGAVNVAPGTPAGTYTVTYQICEQLNPTNCDTAIVTVKVGAAVIDAVNDTGTVANGATGGTAVPNVLVNDTLNGGPATLANVTLTQVSTSNPNVTLDPATGAVNVAPGTPAGTYTVTYQICEQLNPTNCDTATATVTVGAAIIDAVDDTGSVANGATGGVAVPNVLVNDTLNGGPATLANVTLTQVSTSNPSVTLDPATGAVNVAPGTPAGTYTVTYQICEQLNPTNCDVAVVTVTVGAAVIDAVDDTGTVANGATGGTAVPNVLVNDTLNGGPATLANVILTQVSTSNPNVTLDPATGAVNVAPGTPAGTYTLTYRICEQLNPTNCDTAVVTVTVGAAVIDAVDDTGSVANGATGGTAVPNVLVNDTLNGGPATLANVTLTQVSTSNPNVTLDPATGAVNVAPGTPAGTYTLTYQICEQLNPTNCDTAIVTVTVGVAVIDAVNDTGTVANGATGGTAVPNVLVNDTLNGGPATLANVTLTQVSTSNPNVTLDPATGAVNVAPGTPAGTYTLTYRICEQLNPTNCDTATATVTVGAATIDAVDDSGSVANGATGGTAVPNVLVNDTLNGGPATLANVILTQVSTSNPNVTLDPATGAVNVAPGTPAGTYTLTYQICEQLNPTNCDTAIVTVTVGVAVIDAVNDTGTVANGATGGMAVPNVLVNDTLNGGPATLANVTLTQVSTSNPNVTLDPATGAVNVAPGTPAGTYTLTYQICEQLNPTNCDTATATVTVGAAIIDAVDDSGSVANGATGGTAVPNVLVNDTLNGGPATLANVILTQVSTSNPNVTLDPATGAVNVAPGTPAGTYTVTYQICEQLNPTNCDTAIATVTVGAAPAPALTVDKSSSTPTYSAIGQVVNYTYLVTNTGNVTINGITITDDKIAMVTCPQSSLAAGANMTCSGSYTIQASDLTGTPGTVTNLATVNGTPEGGTLTPPTDTVTITEAPNSIVANDDAFGPFSNGSIATTASVLVNDTLSGGGVTAGGNVTLTPGTAPTPVAGSLTMNPDGTITIAAGTTPGTYGYPYTICEIANPTNCDTATATIEVVAAATPALTLTKSASDASFTVGVAGSYTLSVLNSGSAATSAEAVITDTIPSGLTIGALPTGCSAVGQTVTCTIAAGLGAGASTSFIIPVTPTASAVSPVSNSASISGGGDPTCPANARCSSTVVTPVNPVIDAVNDDYSASPLVSTAGGTTASVLANDTLNGASVTAGSNVILTPGTAPSPIAGTIVMNADGTITVAAGTTPGTYNYPYTICATAAPATCDSAVATVVVVAGAQSVDLAITKQASANTLQIGQALTYTLVVTNNGPATATNVVVTDPLPSNFALSSATSTQGSCSGTTTVTCNLGTMLNGAAVTITLAGNVTAAGVAANTATVSAAEAETVMANNTATVSPAVGAADIPTAGEWGLLLLTLSLGLGGVVVMRGRL